ncbi:uncharacterized protein LOC129587077 [Paramacrobiotus metropolitanus]|uniref:uncharacterized protein LOC129587077 n=1 Tax=Paramacrobiotus metropolitanus TaxID=2943436 RepID=UPI002445D9B6|nr:uncharacterized protein LOC129587077 [Paramacrobiotus metropolitanus]
MEYASTGVWSSDQTDEMMRMGTATTSHGLPSSSSRADPSERVKLDFQEAMRSFQHMFPEADEDVIEQVLRANNGAVEKTIDDLLAICSDKDNAAVETDRSGGASDSQKPPPVPSRRPYQRKVSRWNPPLVGPLPDDFLRIVPSEPVRMPIHSDPEPRKSLLNVKHVKDPKKSSSTTKNQNAKPSATGYFVTELGMSEKSDSYLEQLKRDLDHDDELLSSLQKGEKPEIGWDNSAFSTADALGSSSATSAAAPASVRSPDDPNDPQNKNKWNMGAVSKQRFNLFGKQFSLGKKKPKALANKSNAYNHLVEDNNSLVSDDEEEDDHLTDSVTHVRMDRKFSQGS